MKHGSWVPEFITPKFLSQSGSQRTISPKDLIKNTSGIAIIGDPGSGKSVAMTHLAMLLLSTTNEMRIPLFLTKEIEHYLDDQKEKNIEDIFIYFFNEFNKHLSTGNSHHAREVFEKLIDEERLVVFIDGIDEIDRSLKSKGGRDGIVSYLFHIFGTHQGLQRCQFIISSRINRYEECKMREWDNRYEPVLWDEKTIKIYFGKASGIKKILKTTSDRKTLLGLFQLPMFCFLTYQLSERKSNFLTESVGPKRMMDVLPDEPTYLYTRFLTKSWFQRDAVRDTEKLKEALALLGLKIPRFSSTRDQVLKDFEKHFGIGRPQAESIYGTLVDAGIIRGETQADYVKFSHESYSEYFAAYGIFTLLQSFKKNTERNSNNPGNNLAKKKKSIFDSIGYVLPTVEIYSFLRDLSSGYIHTRKEFPGGTGLRLEDVLIILQEALRKYQQELMGNKRVTDETKNLFIVLLQMIRGYLYRAETDDEIKSNIEESLEDIKKTLQDCCSKKDIILRREAAATLAGLDDGEELKKVIKMMLKDNDSYNYHKSFVSRVWGVVEGDQHAKNNARKKAWEIIKSKKGHRPKLKILNIFSLAQFSNHKDDISALEKIKNETEPSDLTSTIDEAIKLIRKNIDDQGDQ